MSLSKGVFGGLVRIPDAVSGKGITTYDCNDSRWLNALRNGLDYASLLYSLFF